MSYVIYISSRLSSSLRGAAVFIRSAFSKLSLRIILLCTFLLPPYPYFSAHIYSNFFNSLLLSNLFLPSSLISILPFLLTLLPFFFIHLLRLLVHYADFPLEIYFFLTLLYFCFDSYLLNFPIDINLSFYIYNVSFHIYSQLHVYLFFLRNLYLSFI